MLEDWQFCFHLKGLVAPTDGVTIGNILVIGVPPSDDADVFFKKTVDTKVDKSDVRDELMLELRNMLQLYGLVADKYVDVLRSSSHRKIENGRPFGDIKIRQRLTIFPVYSEEKRKSNIANIQKTLSKYKVVKRIFNKKSKGFLKNAIDYYNRSLGDTRLEEKLIDLMISLESLFSKENDELGLRYSLRVAFLLSVGQKEKRPEIFETIHILYGKRSKVVHGTEKVKLTYPEISSLQEYVREAIKRLVHIEMSKQDFLELLDESVYNPEKAKELKQIINEAIAKW